MQQQQQQLATPSDYEIQLDLGINEFIILNKNKTIFHLYKYIYNFCFFKKQNKN